MPTREQTVLPRVSRTIEDVRASVFGYVETAQDSLATYGYLPVRLNLNKGVVRGLLEIFCWGYWQIYSLLQRLLQQVSPDGATGEWLDMHAGSVDLSRRAATKARGKVRFARAVETGQDTNITIPAGRIVRTLPDVFFDTARSQPLSCLPGRTMWTLRLRPRITARRPMRPPDRFASW